MPVVRTLILERQGQPVREWTTTIGGRPVLFEFPYKTNDQEEIRLLLAHGATFHTPPVPKRVPVEVAPVDPEVQSEPLKGGDST